MDASLERDEDEGVAFVREWPLTLLRRLTGVG